MENQPGKAPDAPQPTIDIEPRCRYCHRMFARFLTRPYSVDCPKCKMTNTVKDDPE